MRADTIGPMQRATGLYLALHLGPLVVDETVLWGVDGLVYLPAWVTVAFVAISAALLVRSSTEVVDRWMLRIDPWQTPQKAAKSTVIVITLFVAVSYLLEVATPLLGDGMLRLSVRPENLSGTTDDRSLLVTQLARGLSGLDPATVGYGMLSRLAGIAFVVLSFLAARDFVEAAVGRVAIVGALLTSGFVLQFFGYIESYALLFPGLLGFLIAGGRSVRGASVLFPAVLLGVLVSLHPVMVALWPCLALIVALRPVVSVHRASGEVVLATAMALSVVTVTIWATGNTIGQFLEGLGRDPALPVFAEPGFREAYKLLSLAHALDLINALLLAAPGAAIAVFIGTRLPLTKDPVFVFVAAVAGCLLCALSVANPAIGAFRDWDVLALPALPLTILAAIFVSRRFPGSGSAVALLVVGSGLHTALWGAVNSDAAATEDRYVRLLQSTSLSEHGRAYGWDSLGSVRARDARHGLAREAYEAAAALIPDHPRYLSNAGLNAYLDKDYRRSANLNRRVLALNPGQADRWIMAARSYRELGLSDSAMQCYEEALRRDKSEPKILLEVSRGALELGRYEIALDASERLISISEHSLEARIIAGSSALKLGRPNETLQYLLEVASRDPNIALVHMAIGLAYTENGYLDSASAAFERASALDPNLVDTSSEVSHIGSTQNDSIE